MNVSALLTITCELRRQTSRGTYTSPFQLETVQIACVENVFCLSLSTIRQLIISIVSSLPEVKLAALIAYLKYWIAIFVVKKPPRLMASFEAGLHRLTFCTRCFKKEFTLRKLPVRSQRRLSQLRRAEQPLYQLWTLRYTSTPVIWAGLTNDDIP